MLKNSRGSSYYRLHMIFCCRQKMISKDRFTMKMGTKMTDLKKKKRWNCSDGILNEKCNDHKMVTVFM